MKITEDVRKYAAEHLSESPVHSLEFKTEAETRAAFAILSSRLTFWFAETITRC